MCKHVFTWHLRDADYNDICPTLAHYQFDAYSGQGKMGELARALIEGDLEWSDKLLEIIYADPICGACSYNCGRITEMQPSDVILAMRVKAIRDGMSPPGRFKTFLDDLREYLNPYKKLNAERTNWIKGLPAELGEGIQAAETGTRSKSLLYVGCVAMRDTEAEKMPQNAVSILVKAGMDVGVLGEREQCCGNPSLRMGDMEQFIAFARENIKTFNDMGIERIITTCPYCYSTFKRDYPVTGDKMNFEVVHILDVVDQLIKQGKLKPARPVNLTVTYHDPCHLGRLSGESSGTGDFTGIYQQPRDIISSIPGMKLVEMSRIKDDAWCCGGGGWLRDGYLDLAQETGGKRIEEADTTGAEALVTYCPHGEENLGEAIKKSGSKMKMYNLLDLVLQALSVDRPDRQQLELHTIRSAGDITEPPYGG
jgi:Fe-S oxidoreductase